MSARTIPTTKRPNLRKMHPELRKLAEVALAAHWRVTPTRSNHWQFLAPDKGVRPLVTGSTPSDCRALKNFRSDLRRAGLAV